eukprot:gene16356-19413_t
MSIISSSLLQRRNSSHSATVDAGVVLPYSLLCSDVLKLASFFKENNLNVGDRVALLAYNCRELMVAHFALAQLLVIGVNLNTELAPTEHAYMVEDTRPKWIICHKSFQGHLRKVFEAIQDNPSDDTKHQETLVSPHCRIIWIGGDNEPSVPAPSGTAIELTETLETSFLKVMLQTQVQEPPVRGEQDLQESREQGFSIFYTSGTTGKPKGVLLTQGNVYEHAAGCVDAYELKSSDSWLHMAPFFHVLDVWAVFGVTFVGGLHVLMNKFRPEVAIDLLHSLRITVTIFTPAMARLLLKNVTANCSFNLRTVSMGGAGVDEQLIRDIMTTFSCDCFVSYGMTEASGRICVSTVPAQLAHKHNMTPEEVFLLKCTCGHPFHHTEIEIRDDAGKPVAHDGVQVGEVWVRGDTLFKEYWGRPEDSRQAFVDGWLASGDLATINQYGYIMIASRKKDMIIVGGENVYPADVELVLKQMEGVHEVAVYGLPDPMLGETVKAAIVLEDAWAGRLTQSDVLLFASSRLARFKGPHSVFFCRAEDIPRTTTGKVKKEALKKADQAGRLNSSSAQDPLLSTDQSFGLGDAAARALIWKDARLVSSSMQLIFLISGYMLASSYANRGSTWRKVVDFYVQRLSAFYPLYMLSIIMFLPVYFFWADFMDWDSSTLKYLNVVMNLVGLQVKNAPLL